MHSNFKNLLTPLVAITAGASSLFASISLDFTNVSVVSGSTTTYSSAGDQWIATDVLIGSPGALDAVFTITNTSTGSGTIATNQVAFVTESGRGSNMRVRVGVVSPFVTTAQVFIDIDFYVAGTFGTTNERYAWNPGDTMTTQFSDLDSDAGSNRSDFAGVHVDDYTSRSLAPGGTSLLEFDDTFITNYSVANLQTPWEPQGNVVGTDPVSQSPVTAAFLREAQDTIRVVVGQRSSGDTANRHIDIDMTPDFEIIPEPSSIGFLIGLAGLGLVGARRRR